MDSEGACTRWVSMGHATYACPVTVGIPCTASYMWYDIWKNSKQGSRCV